MSKEIFQKLFSSRSVKIERIVSTGQATKEGKWLKSSKNEWVILLEGSAQVRFQKDGRVIKMKSGSHLLIPKNTPHRVDWTATRRKTIWLAVHF